MAVRLEHRAPCSHLNVSINIFCIVILFHLRFPQAVPSRVQHWAELELTWQKREECHAQSKTSHARTKPPSEQHLSTNSAVISFFFAPFLFCFLVVLWCQFTRARTLTRLQIFTSVRNAKESLGETFCVSIETHWITSSQNILNSFYVPAQKMCWLLHLRPSRFLSSYPVCATTTVLTGCVALRWAPGRCGLTLIELLPT